jgi:large subunit ribosomal protein L23
MAIFKSKKKAEIAVEAPKGAQTHQVSFAKFIRKPRITEKAGIAGEANIYTFEVDKNATKGKIKQAVKELYKVTPVKVNIINLPVKNVFVRGKFGTQAGIKKALVFLKKGDKIEIA